MLLGFKRRFAPFVEDGSKTHTIRDRRKTRPKVGETCHCYVDPRQKTMRLLGRFRCVKVDEVTIAFEPILETIVVRINGERLSLDECNGLGWRDGFRGRGLEGAFAEMLEFWDGRLPFEGDMIHWEYKR